MKQTWREASKAALLRLVDLWPSLLIARDDELARKPRDVTLGPTFDFKYRSTLAKFEAVPALTT